MDKNKSQSKRSTKKESLVEENASSTVLQETNFSRYKNRSSKIISKLPV
jgi:hypothetical protein